MGPVLGLGTMDQVVPFHDSARVVTTTRPPPFLIRYEPTAVQAVAEVQETLPRPLVAGPGLGLGTMVQVVPFQDSMSVLGWPVLVMYDPTAVQLLAETQETPLRSFVSWRWDAALGLGTTVQVVPFQDSTRVFDAIPAPVSLPTAVQSLADTQETSLRLLMDLGLRLGTMDQVVPFQDSMNVLDGPPVV